MEAARLCSSISCAQSRSFPCLLHTYIRSPVFTPLTPISSRNRFHRSLIVNAATVLSPKYTSVKPLGDRVLVKVKETEEITSGGILLPTAAQTKPQGGEVVAIGDGKFVGKNKASLGVKVGNHVVYSKYAGTEMEINGSNHLILKDDDIFGLLETEEIKDLKPLNDRVLIKVVEAEEKTAGGLFLTEASKDKPSIGSVIGVGPGSLDDEGKIKPITIKQGSTVMYSRFAGNEFKGNDGANYIVLRASDIVALLS